ncbi:MAG TPA: hypothetical protein PLL30_13675 [Candidatus Krumholzibacteria bacterium]|nr:hypothetical protein [Candidatus Krumholzibacteria bacterium]HPD72814.1 hypothetical protein [Candidatus Krumholzibacteria bacterium]HRY40254.1 hypothetical protein [Candidatus Krumholzibacteria bacterium]
MDHAAPRPPLLLDLGNVLVDLDFERFVAAAATASPRSPGEIRDRYILGEAKRSYERGLATSAAFFAELAAWLRWPAGRRADLVRCWCDIFTATPGAEAAVRRLAAARPLWVLSDTNPAHLVWCRSRWPWFGLCARWIVSCETGRLKADVGAFAPVVAAALPHDSPLVFYDDLPANVAAARREGLDGRLFTGWAAALAELDR